MTNELTDLTRSLSVALCPICQCPLALRPARGRKSGKLSLMLVCAQDQRHFRGFINDRDFVNQVYGALERLTPPLEAPPDLAAIPAPGQRSTIDLERASES
jgi:uncharacterized protein YbaR (Trm112 family)